MSSTTAITTAIIICVTAWLERFQVPVYLGALVLGALISLWNPSLSGSAETAITPLLVALLYATFLSIPFANILTGLRDVRFIATLMVLNFLVVPAVVFLLTRPLVHTPVVLIAVLFVLLTPCIDYVIVFTTLAGGDNTRLLATTPLLMLAQTLLLPMYLMLFADPSALDAISLGPFLKAFALFILLPLVAAVITQNLARHFRFATRVSSVCEDAMVPVMALTLASVTLAHFHLVPAHAHLLSQVVLIYIGFAVTMSVIGYATARFVRLEAPRGKALLFSGVTRNSLVVLPLVMALPAGFELAPAIVVTQTFIELLTMVILVWILRPGQSRRKIPA